MEAGGHGGESRPEHGRIRYDHVELYAHTISGHGKQYDEVNSHLDASTKSERTEQLQKQRARYEATPEKEYDPQGDPTEETGSIWGTSSCPKIGPRPLRYQ